MTLKQFWYPINKLLVPSPKRKLSEPLYTLLHAYKKNEGSKEHCRHPQKSFGTIRHFSVPEKQFDATKKTIFSLEKTLFLTQKLLVVPRKTLLAQKTVFGIPECTFDTPKPTLDTTKNHFWLYNSGLRPSLCKG